jgi:hypothetical protein
MEDTQTFIQDLIKYLKIYTKMITNGDGAEGLSRKEFNYIEYDFKNKYDDQEYKEFLSNPELGKALGLFGIRMAIKVTEEPFGFTSFFFYTGKEAAPFSSLIFH